MATRDLADAERRLSFKFRRALDDFSRTWLAKRYEIRIATVLRTDEEQKALFWWSREMKNGKIVQRVVNGKLVPHKTFLDGVIDKSRHQPNDRGKSEAIDFFVLKKSTGKPDWAARVVFHVFGRLCKRHGLTWGGSWIGFRDLGHVQLD